MSREKRVSVAPMLDWTDRHCRFFHRLINTNAYLYTEMITTGALIHGDRDRHLSYAQQEHPLVLQLGGSNPADLAICSEMGGDYGYDEINLNCGCPSDRVQNGAFGACLMKEPELVGECISAMGNAVKIPVTVKCRIGIDDCDEAPFLEEFLKKVSNAGCERFVIHARKAWLKGLSPKENRDIPPLRYDIVQAMRDKFPNLLIELNGGIQTPVDISDAMEDFDGAMIGREAYSNPSILACDVLVDNPVDKSNVVEKMGAYIANELQQGRIQNAHAVTRHMIGLFQGCKGARYWRRTLSERARFCSDEESVKILFDQAMEQLEI